MEVKWEWGCGFQDWEGVVMWRPGVLVRAMALARREQISSKKER